MTDSKVITKIEIKEGVSSEFIVWMYFDNDSIERTARFPTYRGAKDWLMRNRVNVGRRVKS